jgi:hypothetical protein
MKLETKAQISHLTLLLLTFVAFVFVLGVLVLVLCTGLQINPFRETTTSFLIASFMGLIGIAGIMVLVNVAMNLSLIADAKIVDLKIERRSGVIKKWLITFSGIAGLLVAIIFAGTYFSKEKFLSVVENQADEVLKENESMLTEIDTRLTSAKPADFKRLTEIIGFLENQRRNLPQLTLIYSKDIVGKPAIYRVDNYFYGNLEKNEYTPQYYACEPNIDCDYLKKFFAGDTAELLKKYTLRDDEFYIYVPVIKGHMRFMLMFDRRNSYGKLGSS